MTQDAGKRVRVAVDAMGGDHAPGETVRGAVAAARAGGVDVLLVGEPGAVLPELERHGAKGLPVLPVPSEGVIREGESPVQALRQKPKASIAVAVGLAKAGKADAVVTMGATGAAMAASAFLLGMLEGIERPALGGPIIGFAPNTVILDLGSSVDSRPAQLVTFAALGAAFARSFLRIAEPRVALLSVGAEEGKGNRQVKETAELFKASGLSFAGNVEGHDLALGRAHVVICDGFVGNVLMKLAEGIGEAASAHLRQRLSGKLSEVELDTLCREVYDLLNVVEKVGGGPLFGINGLVIVGHGRSRAPAVAHAIATAKTATEVDLIESMKGELARLRGRLPT